VEFELADDRVVQPLDAFRVQTHVVRGPEDAELVALGGELADQVGERPVCGLPPAYRRRSATVSFAARSQSV
jgi:hypothetical protein